MEGAAITVQALEHVPAVRPTAAGVPARPITRSSAPAVLNVIVGELVVPETAVGGVARLGSKGPVISAPVTVNAIIAMLGVVPPDTVSLTVWEVMALVGTPQNSAAVAPVVEAVFLELKVIPPPDMLGVPGVPELVVTKTIMTSEVDALIVLEQVTVAVAVAVAVPLQEAPSVGGVWANATWTPGSDARAPMTITKTSASAFLRITPLAPLALLPGSVPSRASATSRRITIRLAAKGHCRYLSFRYTSSFWLMSAYLSNIHSHGSQTRA